MWHLVFLLLNWSKSYHPFNREQRKSIERNFGSEFLIIFLILLNSTFYIFCNFFETFSQGINKKIQHTSMINQITLKLLVVEKFGSYVQTNHDSSLTQKVRLFKGSLQEIHSSNCWMTFAIRPNALNLKPSITKKLKAF